MGEIAINPEDMRYCKQEIMNRTQELNHLSQKLSLLFNELQAAKVDDNVAKYVSSISIEGIKQKLYTALLEEYSRGLSDIVTLYEEAELQANAVLNQSR